MQNESLYTILASLPLIQSHSIHAAASVISCNTVLIMFSLNTLDGSSIAQRKKTKVLRPSSSSKVSFQIYLLRWFCTICGFCIFNALALPQKLFSFILLQFSLELPSHPSEHLEMCLLLKVELKKKKSLLSFPDFLGNNELFGYSLLCIYFPIYFNMSCTIVSWLSIYLLDWKLLQVRGGLIHPCTSNSVQRRTCL